VGESLVDQVGGSAQRTIKHETPETELRQVLKTGKWGVVASFSILALFVLDAMLVGYLAGMWVGYLIIVWMFATFQKQAIQKRDEGLQVFQLIILLISLLVWTMGGSRWLEGEWIPYRIHVAGWALILIELISWGLKVWLLTVAWRLWWEIVDPNGPTPTRQPVVRDKGIAPWDKETYGKGDFPPVPEAPRKAIPWKFEGSLDSNNGAIYTEFETHHAPEWHYFCRDLMRQREQGKRPRFSFRAAGRWKVPEKEFKAVVDEWVKHGYAFQEANARGNGSYHPLRKGWKWIEGVATTIPDQPIYE